MNYYFKKNHMSKPLLSILELFYLKKECDIIKFTKIVLRKKKLREYKT